MSSHQSELNERVLTNQAELSQTEKMIQELNGTLATLKNEQESLHEILIKKKNWM